MNQKQNLRKSIFAAIILIAVIAIMIFVYTNNQNKKAASVKQGEKNITIEVIVPEEEPKEYTISTDADYLRQALDEKELINGEDSGFGFFITEVNGRVADEANQEWWCITKGGEEILTGVDEIALQDGDQYEITLTVGY